MAQSLTLVVLFVAALGALPWLVRRWQQGRAGLAGRAAQASLPGARVLDQLHLSPQQRVVTVEVGPEGQRTRLVLGVSPQQIACLHVLAAATGSALAAAPSAASAAPSFAQSLAGQRAEGPPHA